MPLMETYLSTKMENYNIGPTINQVEPIRDLVDV